MSKKNKDKAIANGITTKGGLLWRDGEVIHLPEADTVARKYGHLYAEGLVKALKEEG